MKILSQLVEVLFELQKNTRNEKKYQFHMFLDTFRQQLKYPEQHRERVEIQIWFQMITEITQRKTHLIASTRFCHLV